MLDKKFPQWFIDQIVDPVVKQKAIDNKLTAKEMVKFQCSKGHLFERVVGNYITLCFVFM